MLSMGFDALKYFKSETFVVTLSDQHKLLKEPGGVSKVPFRRTHTWHSLNHEILGLHRAAQIEAPVAHPPIAVYQR